MNQNTWAELLTHSLPRSLESGHDILHRFSMSADGKRACATGRCHFQVWDVVTGQMLHTRYSYIHTFPAFSPDGLWVLVGNRLLDGQSYEVVAGDAVEGRYQSVMFSPDNAFIACWGPSLESDRTGIRLHHNLIPNSMPDDTWDQSSIWNFRRHWEEPFERASNLYIEPHEPDPIALCAQQLCFIFSVAFTPDSQRLAFSTLQATVGVLDVLSGDLLWEVQTQSRNFSDVRHDTDLPPAAPVAISPDGRLVAHGLGWGRDIPYDYPGSAPRAIEVRYVESGEIFHTFWSELPSPSDEDCIPAVSFSPNGRFLATSYPVRIWDLNTLEMVSELPEGRGRDIGLAFTPDGLHLISARNYGGNGEVRAWDLPANIF